MKKAIALILALVFALTAGSALAANDPRVDSIEYKGFGIVEIDFTWDCDWYPSADISLTDASGSLLPIEIIGGEAENCFLRAVNLADGTMCTLKFVLGDTAQTIAFDAVTGIEYFVRNDDTVNPREENDRCDRCGLRGHDEDFCPERINAADLPDDPDMLARMFDIDRCERCGGIGHDDDRCPNGGGYDD